MPQYPCNLENDKSNHIQIQLKTCMYLFLAAANNKS